MHFKVLSLFILCFISGSIYGSGGNTQLSLNTNNIQGELIENCASTLAFVVITRDSIALDSISYRITRSGTAIDTLDYRTNLTDTITFLPGQQILVFDILAVNDSISEGLESIRFELFQIGVSDILCDSLNILIRDQLNVKLSIGDNSTYCIPPNVSLFASGAIEYTWSPENLFTNPANDTVVLFEAYNGPIILTGSGMGCAETDTVQLDFFTANIEIGITPNDSICLGDTVVLNINAEGVLDSLLIKPESYVIAQTDTSITLLPTQTTNFIINTYSDLCSYVDSVLITVDSIDIPQLIEDSTICFGDSIILSHEFVNSLNSSSHWSPSIGLSNDTIPNPLAYPILSTTYALLTTGAKGICKNEDEVKIDVIDNRVDYTLLGKDTFCLGGQTKALFITNGSRPNISISPNSSASFNGDTITYFPSTTTTYTILVDFGDCSQEIEETITIINPEFEILAEPSATICIGDSVKLTLNLNDKPENITWTPNINIRRQDDSTYIAKPSISSSYNVLIDYGFCTHEETIQLNVIDNLFEINLPTDTTICQGEEIDGKISFNREPNTISVSPLDQVILFGTDIQFAPNRTTSYDIVADYGACIITKTLRINVDSLPDLTITSMPDLNKHCEGQTIDIIPATYDPLAYPNIIFDWSPNDVNVVGQVNEAGLNLQAISSQSFSRSTMNGVCSSSLTYDLEVVPEGLSIPFTDTSICIGNEIPFVIEDIDISNIRWSPPRNITCEFCPNPIISPLESTLYTVSYTRDGCSFSEDIQINVSDIDTTYFPPIIGCKDSIIQINIQDPLFDNSIWDDDTDLSCTMCNDPTFTLSAPTTFTLRDFDAMCVHVGILEVDVYSEISVNIELLNEEEDIFIGQEIILNSNISATHQTTVNWMVNGLLINDNTEKVNIIADQFNYTISVEVIDNVTGCSATDEITIAIKSIDKIRFPNIFSPNGDGRNDDFKPALAQILSINTMKIFNRWGQLIFESSSPDASWDGRMPDGKDAPSDTYIYIVDLTRPNGVTEQHQGDINLLR